MPRIRNLNSITEDFVESASVAERKYRQGVENPLQSWKEGATRASGNWERGVQEAISRNSFARGVEESSDDQWRRAAMEKGSQRIGSGIRAANESYQRGFAPYHDVIERTTLPPRGIKGSPENYDRARLMGEALHQAKMEMEG